MILNKPAGFLSIIIGLIFIIYPMLSADVVSIIVGLSLLYFGITAIYMGIIMRNNMNKAVPIIIILLGLISFILGVLFIFYIDAVSFLVAFQFYIVGFIMIAFGITGIISRPTDASLFGSVLVLIMGVLSIALAAFALAQPVYIAIIIGVILIAEGLVLLVS